MEPLIVAGVDDALPRSERATASYEPSRYAGDSPLWPDGGLAAFRPLLDEVLGANHVVRVRLAPGARSARHTHDCDQVMVVVDGHGSLVTDDGIIDLRPGSVVLTPRRVPHVHAAGKEDEVEYVYFTASGHDTVVDDIGDAS